MTDSALFFLFFFLRQKAENVGCFRCEIIWLHKIKEERKEMNTQILHASAMCLHPQVVTGRKYQYKIGRL